jgi:hypothetical protein
MTNIKKPAADLLGRPMQHHKVAGGKVPGKLLQEPRDRFHPARRCANRDDVVAAFLLRMRRYFSAQTESI